MKSIFLLSALFIGTFAQTSTTTSTTATTTTTPTPTTTYCPTSHSHTHCPHSRSTHCHTRRHHHDHCCPTQTVCTRVNDCECKLIIYPCPSNTTVMITETVTVTASVAPLVAAVVDKICVPCTSVVTETVMPSLVCTTMIFCDIADQSENCRLQNELNIESIASVALRQGGQVFVNGQLVVFESASGSAKTSVISGSTVVTVTGMDANSADGVAFNWTLVSLLLSVAAGFIFA